MSISHPYKHPRLIMGARNSGKTAYLIKLCRENGGYILCAGEAEATRIFGASFINGKPTIPMPLTIDDIKSDAYHDLSEKYVYIYDLYNVFLHSLPRGIYAHIRAVSLDFSDWDTIQEFSTWDETNNESTKNKPRRSLIWDCYGTRK